MELNDPGARERLARFLGTGFARGPAEVLAATRLSGGTLQENWRIGVRWADSPGTEAAYVVRTTGESGVGRSASRAQEFALLRAAEAAGVPVPRALWLCTDASVLGTDFLVMAYVDGVAEPQQLLRRDDGEAIATRLGEAIACLQRVRRDEASLRFLPQPPQGAAQAMVAELRAGLDGLGQAHPAIEWTLNWLALRAPPAAATVLCHGDFRTGNYLVDASGQPCLLDFELAHWGDPLSDLGWFCARFWRFGRDDRPAGGLAARDALYRGYERVACRSVDRVQAHYWEVMANARWALISQQQVRRHLAGAPRSLELALVGRQTAEAELEALRLIGTSPQGAWHER